MPTIPVANSLYTGPQFRSFNVTRSKSTPSTVSPFSGDLQVYEWVGSEKFQWTGQLPPVSVTADKEAWIEFLLDMEGMSETFTFDLNSVTNKLHKYAPLPSSTSHTLPTTWRLAEPVVGWSIDISGLLVGIEIKAIEP